MGEIERGRDTQRDSEKEREGAHRGASIADAALKERQRAQRHLPRAMEIQISFSR